MCAAQGLVLHLCIVWVDFASVYCCCLWRKQRALVIIILNHVVHFNIIGVIVFTTFTMPAMSNPSPLPCSVPGRLFRSAPTLSRPPSQTPSTHSRPLSIHAARENLTSPPTNRAQSPRANSRQGSRDRHKPLFPFY